MNSFLHIVCLDAPSPPDYGGAIDMYYKIEALAKAGKKIILHYFDYKEGRGVQGLEDYCVEINRYSRKSFSLTFLYRPYITASRVHKKLLHRLNADTHPILIEGLHGAGLIRRIENSDRVVLRMHNEEVAYYAQLSGAEQNQWKRMYLRWESKRLHAFQKHLAKDLKLAVLSETDIKVFREEYEFTHTQFIPCFLPWQKISGEPGTGNYCLYHGNLSVAENEQAALWLIGEVFMRSHLPLIVAGKGVSQRLKDAAAKAKKVTIVSNPSMQRLDHLIREAHINVLPSLNSTGVKLKLLHALFDGRFVITNSNGVSGSGIRDGVAIADTAEAFIEKVNALMTESFSNADVEKRKDLLKLYNNDSNARKLMELW